MFRTKYFITLCLAVVLSCADSQKTENQTKLLENQTIEKATTPTLDLTQANRLAQLPLDCIQTEYPNKLNQVIGGDEELQSPKALHPAFYGCFDWHSSVHGHWSLVSLLKQFPELNNRQEIMSMLLENISQKNIENEVSYFFGKHNSSYERTYGWAWLLKLAEELHTWDHPDARLLEANLQLSLIHI